MKIHRIGVVLGLLALVSIMCGVPTSSISNMNSNNPTTASPTSELSNTQPTPSVLLSQSNTPMINSSGLIPTKLDFSSLPSDIPLLGNISNSSQNDTYWYVYSSQTNFDEAINFYKSRLSQDGWKEFRTVTGSPGNPVIWFFYEKSNRRIEIELGNTVGAAGEKVERAFVVQG